MDSVVVLYNLSEFPFIFEHIHVDLRMVCFVFLIFS